MDRTVVLIPIIGYICLTTLLAFWCRQYATKTNSKDFLEEYFIGSRSLGGFALAMAIIATYTSASSFVGGPGIAYALGPAVLLEGRVSPMPWASAGSCLP